MLTLADPSEAAAWSASQRRAGRSVAFVPTMGALHEGHLALVRSAVGKDVSVAVSIFVNPLQFNNADDLKHYPRQVEADAGLLAGTGCDLLFTPNDAGIFAGFTPRTYDLGGLEGVLEGASRPGHFQGVVNVVERLFHYVRPDRAIFGEKDRQQLAVIRHVAQALYWPVEIIGHATLRAASGLALSSRNMRLSEREREKAAVLYRSLRTIEARAFRGRVEDALSHGLAELRTESDVRPDYLRIADPATLQSLEDWGTLNEAVALVAAWVGPVRLIDNITLRR